MNRNHRRAADAVHSTPPRIELHIGELVLEGFPAIDRAQLDAVIRQELARILVEQGVPPGWTQGADVTKLDGGQFRVTSNNANAQVLGTQIAKAIYGEFEQ